MKDHSQLSNDVAATVKRRAVERARELGAASVRVAAADEDAATRDAMRAAFDRELERAGFRFTRTELRPQ